MSKIRVIRVWLVCSVVCLLDAQTKTELPSKSSPDDVSSALVAQLDKFDLVALGEWHNTREDQDLRIRLVRHPDFARKVRNVVVECGNALYQDILDRYVAGEGVAKQDIQRVWRDTTQSPVGGGDSPVCEQFLNEIRSINRELPKGLKVRVLAGDPPIDWTKVKSAEDFLPFLRGRDEFSAQLLAREVLGKKEKALIVYGAGHIWRRNIVDPAPNLAKLIDQASPGNLFTVVRLGGPFRDTAKLESLMPRADRPVFLPLKGTPAGALSANEFIGRDVPVKLFPEGLGIGEVADACVYSGQAPDALIGPNPLDAAYEAEKERRRAFLPRPRR